MQLCSNPFHGCRRFWDAHCQHGSTHQKVKLPLSRESKFQTFPIYLINSLHQCHCQSPFQFHLQIGLIWQSSHRPRIGHPRSAPFPWPKCFGPFHSGASGQRNCHKIGGRNVSYCFEWTKFTIAISKWQWKIRRIHANTHKFGL